MSTHRFDPTGAAPPRAPDPYRLFTCRRNETTKQAFFFVGFVNFVFAFLSTVVHCGIRAAVSPR